MYCLLCRHSSESWEAVGALARHVVLKAPDKADHRAVATEAAVALMSHLPTMSQHQFVLFAARLARTPKVGTQSKHQYGNNQNYFKTCTCQNFSWGRVLSSLCHGAIKLVSACQNLRDYVQGCYRIRLCGPANAKNQQANDTRSPYAHMLI